MRTLGQTDGCGGQQLFDLILQTASGCKTLSEELGFGQEEFVPWQLGAAM
jgi:altronate hydrolase